ncbi:uncharacterized protein LOC142803920 isoform X5 [Rhipicephalus microplus]|uniref:uncharacterized protein LOC142803920 isoform X5 n=1 Tax=Rhipicephalus microplus TaxID=6941 RepID=UPI003F6ACC15
MAAIVCVVRLETGEQKKVVLPTGSYDELVHALSTHTAVDEQTLLQVFDTEVDEYIDLEKDCTILSKFKIKVGRKVLPPTTDPNSSECIEAGPSSRAHDPSREHLNQSADSICTTELVEIHVPLRKQYDSLEFRLPAFGPYEEVLQRGEPVEGPVRRAIINRIFQACFKIVWFPSKELYNTAVEQLIQKYPHLRDNIKKGTGMDNPELIVYGETAEGRRWHHEWLTENASTAGDDELRPCLLATAKERHERLERMTIQQALLEYPFLATEHSVCSYLPPLFCDICGKHCDLSFELQLD